VERIGFRQLEGVSFIWDIRESVKVVGHPKARWGSWGDA
jgi:hypothetical protein